MPHSIFLGSALATQDRISPSPNKLARIDSTWSVDSDATAAVTTEVFPWRVRIWRKVKEEFRAVFRVVPIEQYASDPKSHDERQNHPFAFVRAHIYHGMIDIAVSLLGLAVVINSL